MSRVLTVGLILAAAAFVYLIGNGRTQLFDRDEPRYAQCSRQMLQSGDWVVPRLYDRIRAAKPPGIYWCQATAMAVFGDNAFAARLPSSLAMLITLGLTAAAVWRSVGSRRACWASFILASSLLTIWCAKVCMIDSVLLLCTSVALLCMYRLWRGGGMPAAAGLGIAIGLGGLAKGPFILGVLACTWAALGLLAVLDRRSRPVPVVPTSLSALRTFLIRLGVGAILVAGLVVPWLLLVHHRQPGFLQASTGDAMHHLESGSEGHWAPPGYHLLLIWFTFLPWSPLLPAAIACAIRNRAVPQTRFALAAVCGTWFFVDFIVQTKLPHYMLPAFPALAYLTADLIVRCLDGERGDLRSRMLTAAFLVFAVAVAGISTAPWWWLAIRFHSFPMVSLIALTLFGIVFAATVWFLFLRGRPRCGLIAMGAGSMILGALLFGLYFPHAEPLRLSIRVADVLRRNNVVRPGQALMLDYKEPSLAFYQGGTIREAKHSLQVMDHLSQAPPWLVMTRRVWNDAPSAARARLRIVGSPLDGFNYSDDMRPTELLIVRNTASGGDTRDIDTE